MTTKVKIEIEIEKDLQTGFSGKFRIVDMLFTSFSTQLNPEFMLNNVKTALKKLGGFDMITAHLIIQPENEYMLTNDQICKAFRFVVRNGEIMHSPLHGNKFDDWKPSSAQAVNTSIKELVNLANVKFIDILRNQTQTV